MRYHWNSPVLTTAAEEGLPLLTAKTFVVATGHQLLLGAMCQTWFIKPALIAGFTTERETVDCCEAEKPSFLLVVDDLEQGYGINTIKKVKDVSPDTKCILFTDRETISVVRDALTATTDGVVFISSIGMGMEGDFVPALKAISEGGIYYPPAVREKAGFELRPLPDLSARELDVLKELCNGKSNKAIAETLFLSVDTIKCHVSNVIAKLGAEDRLSAAVMGIRAGL